MQLSEILFESLYRCAREWHLPPTLYLNPAEDSTLILIKLPPSPLGATWYWNTTSPHYNPRAPSFSHCPEVDGREINQHGFVGPHAYLHSGMAHEQDFPHNHAITKNLSHLTSNQFSCLLYLTKNISNITSADRTTFLTEFTQHLRRADEASELGMATASWLITLLGAMSTLFMAMLFSRVMTSTITPYLNAQFGKKLGLLLGLGLCFLVNYALSGNARISLFLTALKLLESASQPGPMNLLHFLSAMGTWIGFLSTPEHMLDGLPLLGSGLCALPAERSLRSTTTAFFSNRTEELAADPAAAPTL